MEKCPIPPLVVPASENYPEELFPTPGCEGAIQRPGPAWVTDEKGYGSKVTDDILPHGWGLHAKSWCTLKIVEDVAHWGNRSVCISPARDGGARERPSNFRVDAGKQGPRPVRPGQIYNFSMWYKTAGAAGISAKVFVFGPPGFDPASGARFRVLNLAATGTSAEWKRLQTYIISPPKAEELGAVIIGGSLDHPDARIWIDDLSLRQAPTAKLPLTERAPIIDGRLDDAVWGSAGVIDWTKALAPINGAKPAAAQETNCRLLRDAQNLYVAVRCHEPSMDSIHSVSAAADWEDREVRRLNRVELFIVPASGDSPPIYRFVVNAPGNHAGLRYGEPRNGYEDWSTTWEANTGWEKDAWTVEARIPITDIGHKTWAESGILRFNLLRARKLEDTPAAISVWSPPSHYLQAPKLTATSAPMSAWLPLRPDVDAILDTGLLILK